MTVDRHRDRSAHVQEAQPARRSTDVIGAAGVGAGQGGLAGHGSPVAGATSVGRVQAKENNAGHGDHHIRTVSGGSPAIFRPLTPLTVPLLLKPRRAGDRGEQGPPAGSGGTNASSGACDQLIAFVQADDLHAAEALGWCRMV